MTEAVLIDEAASTTDIVMNLKGEIHGNRLPRVVIDRGLENEHVKLEGNLEFLDKLKKFVEDLAEGEYNGGNFWDNILEEPGTKRKHDGTREEEREQEDEEKTNVKKMKMMTKEDDKNMKKKQGE